MIFFSLKIKDPALMIMFSSSLFMISVLTIFLGSFHQNVYVIGFGIILTGISDCSCMVLGLSLAGLWKQKGISTYNVFQCVTCSITTSIMIFVPFLTSIIWIGSFYMINIIFLSFYRKKKNELIQNQ